jgi:hypothetical protein
MKKSEKAQAPPTLPKPVRTAKVSANVSGWTFLTNHAHVLLCLHRDPDQRLRDVAGAVGITERMVQRIVAELEEAGFLRIYKEGRRNRYSIDTQLHLRHSLAQQHTIGELLNVLRPESPRAKRR